MRTYAALFDSKQQRWMVIYRDEDEQEWYVETYVDDQGAAIRIVSAFNAERIR